MKQTKLNLFSALLLVAAMTWGTSAFAQDFTIEASYESSAHRTTYTIRRSGSNLPAQTINYRTVNLSAYAGQHYTAVSGTIDFPATANSYQERLIQVNERTPDSDAYAFKYQTDDSRSYRFEVLDVNGFQLAYYDRSMTTGAHFTNTYVNSSITDLMYFNNNGSIQSGSGNKYLDVSHSGSSGTWIQVTDAGYQNNGARTISTSSLFNNNSSLRTILNHLDYKMYATVYFTQKEEHDGYQYIQIYSGNTFDTGDDPNGGVDNPVNSFYKACFILSYDESVMSSAHHQFFPHRYNYVNKAAETNEGISHYSFDYDDSYLYKQKFLSNAYKASSSGSLVLPTTTTDINIRFDAGGGGNDNDEWDFKDLKARLALVDATKPTLYNNSTAGITVSAGPYVKGNTFYISVPFSEIVHIGGSPKGINTSWGYVYYDSGDYTNVITFKGTINAPEGTVLRITDIYGCTFIDLAGNGDSFTAATSFDKTFSGVTCTANYTLVATNTSFSGLGDNWISDGSTVPQPDPTVCFYKGIMNNTNQVTLTKNTDYTISWANNTTPGDGTVTATGKGIYNGSASVTFPIRWATYTIRFHANDGIYGTHATEDQLFTYNTPQQLSSTLTRAGYTVTHWTTNADGTGTSYGATQEVFNLSAVDGTVIDLYAQWAVIPWTGSGDNPNDPYVIIYASQLDSLAATVNNGKNYRNKYFKLGANISYPHTTSWNDANSTENNYTAIGNDHRSFDGTFDGDGHTISGIRIYTTSNNQGLFGNVRKEIKNIILSDTRITGYKYVAGIAGEANSCTISNCRVVDNVAINDVSSNNHHHGGIVGSHVYGTISGCVSNAAISGNGYYHAGIVGTNYEVTIKDCLFTGTVSNSSNNGSIAGTNTNGIYINNYYTANGPGGVSGSDIDGARRARTVTLLNGDVVLVGDETAYSASGITAIGTGNCAMRYNSTLYSGDTQTLILNHNGMPATGCVWNGFSTTAGTLTGNALTVPDADVAVSATTTDVWGVTNTPAADGSRLHPYLISDTIGLNLLSRNVNGSDGYTANSFSGNYFKLADNISYSYADLGADESNYSAIGTTEHCFSGIFDGDNRTVSGIRIYTTSFNQGLFGFVSNGTVKNLTLTDAVITGTGLVGAIVGQDYGTNTYFANYYRNCTVGGTANATDVGTGLGDIAGIRSLHTITLGEGISANGSETKVIDNVIYYASVSTITLSYGGTVPEGYSHNGYIYNNGSDHVVSGNSFTMPSADITVSANIVPIVYTLNYDLGGGTLPSGQDNPDSYTIESADITLVNPIRMGYVFAGWTGDGLNAATATVTISNGSIGNRSYSATWTDVWRMADGANGDEKHPYVITTTAGLDLLAQMVNGTDGYICNTFYEDYFKLGADIDYSTKPLDANDENYTAIGCYRNGTNHFHGTFDGCGHTVSGIRINKGGNQDSTDEYQGLFGITEGTVKNVTLTDADITGWNNVGGIVGSLEEGGTVKNCHVTSSVTLHAVQNNANCFGGIVGYSYSTDYYVSTIADCSSAATITLADGLTNCRHFGGIVGYLQSHLKNCIVLGAALPDLHYGNHDASGAIVGFQSDDSYTLSHNYYHGVTIGGETTGIGIGFNDNGDNRHDITTYNGAMTVYALTLGEHISVSPIAACTYRGHSYFVEGTTITLSAEGYTLSGSYTVKDAQNDDVPLTDGNTFVMPASDVTVSGNLTAFPWSGSGTEGDPYIILYRSQLDLLAERLNSGMGDDYAASGYNGKFFQLGANIHYPHISVWDDAYSTENNYTAIGNTSHRFKGTFDGLGHTVIGIRIYKDGDSNDYQGLFGRVEGGTVKNVTLTDARITGGQNVGGIVGDLVGNLQNCLAIGACVSGNNGLGAIVGSAATGLSTLSHNYYHNCTIDGNTGNGVGCGNPAGDITEDFGAVPCFRLTLPTVLTTSGNTVLNYQGQHYVAAGVTVTPAPVYTDYTIGTLTYNDGSDHTVTPNEGVYSFTMPAHDATVTVNWAGLPDWSGSGEIDDPWVITTCAELDALAIRVNDGNDYHDNWFKLGADLSYSHTTAWDDTTSIENNYTAIGGYFNDYRRRFNGIFDGCGHTISGIRIYKGGNDYGDSYQGLFGYTYTSYIHNVILTDARITGYCFVGGIIGNDDEHSDAVNCHVTATVAIHAVANNSKNHGGIIGFIDGTCKYCTSAATLSVAYGVTGCELFGGIAGYSDEITSYCIAKGVTISGAAENSGAIVGEWDEDLVCNYYHTCSYGTATTNIGTGQGDEEYSDAVPAEEVSITVPGYGDGNGGWHFIASPMDYILTPLQVQNLIVEPEAHYDLYRFNQEAAGAEWQNYKRHSGSVRDGTIKTEFLIEDGMGYLYASKEDVTLTFLGRPNDEATISVDLSYNEGNPLSGYNLVGNPFAEPATLNRSYYRMNAEGTGIVAEAVGGSTAIAPYTGVIVQAMDAYQWATFTRVTTRGEMATGNGSLNIALHQAQGPIIDNAVISFDEGSELGKFYFGEQDANIYIPQDGKEYAIAHSDMQGEMPVCFKAKKDGEYTLSVSESLNSKFQILNLIDNLTGANIDLLQTPSYTFTARSDDYPSRFKLVFSAQQGGEEADDDFAFISDGNIIVTGTGTLQVIDMLGHVLVSHEVNSSLLTPHSSLSAGVYVLRLINRENVRTQKIIIK